MQNFTLLTVIMENLSTLTNVTIMYNYNGNSNLWQVLLMANVLVTKLSVKDIFNSNDNN